MKSLFLVPMMAVLLFVGCSEPEPEPPPAPPALEVQKKTADQLYQETMKKLNPHLRPNTLRPGQVRDIVKDANTKYRPPVEPNGEEALTKIKRDLNQRMDAAAKLEQWDMIIALAVGLDVFAKGPPERTGELKKIARLRKMAVDELSKPKVVVKAFVDDFVGLKITFPATKTVVSKYVREGDSFIDDPEEPGKKLLRLENIIGDNRGVVVYYYKTGTSWTVPGPRG